MCEIRGGMQVKEVEEGVGRLTTKRRRRMDREREGLELPGRAGGSIEAEAPENVEAALPLSLFHS